jgi:adenosylcobinamide kinase/adenosylcobinamide-phosphate guanylyltransferase
MLNLHFILGGARSGKSRLAENIAKSLSENIKNDQACNNILYIATAQADDDEMTKRINKHQKDRPSSWQLIEEPQNLAKVIRQYACNDNILLIDCLTLWLSNCLCQQGREYWLQQKQAFIDTLLAVQKSSVKNSTIILVSNEVGHGIVPLGELSREFVDQSGWLHQELAEISDQVDFVIAGIAMALKPK